MTGTPQTWLAAYLYYAEPWENFLIDSVQPFVNRVFDKKLAEQFFFIRYWEQGPHIRIRFKGDPRVMEEQVKPILDSHFREYFSRHPGKREDPEGMEKWKPEHRWYPNNTVQYIEYEPEVERYGGPTGILIGERQFQVSSRAVFAVVEECDEWDYDRALGAAIQLHLGFAFAMGMDLLETSEFYTRISKMWFARAYGYTEDTPKEEIQKRQEITLNAFKENFERQKSILVPYHQTLWGAFTEGMEFEQEWLNQWTTGMKIIREELETAQRQEKLLIPQWFKPEPGQETPGNRQLLWPILESYVHMTNNRLGILNRDEAYLGYLIKESLKDV
ncbi:MAG: hypothetical protein GY950_17100 [bacterium]|nr:hypothetical protein [bacterium]